MRLEYLFARLAYHRADTSAWGRRAALEVILDVLSVLSRFDISGEVSKALGKCYSQMASFRGTDHSMSQSIDETLAQIDDLGRRIQRVPSNFASYLLRDDELLYNLNNRSPIAGGSCGFDLPAYQFWLAQPAERIEADIAHWCQYFGIFESAIDLLLGLLRDGATPSIETAEKGVCIYNTTPNALMLRVFVDTATVFPQISAGRHRATIRFMGHVDQSTRVKQSQATFHFQLACCSYV